MHPQRYVCGRLYSGEDKAGMILTQHRCFIVATCDKDLKSRIRKVPGVPIMYIKAHKYTIERLPDNIANKA